MITTEGRRLGLHWDRAGSDVLDRYLIQEVEHPGYNVQSVLVRAFLADRLFPGEAGDLIEEELYFSACASFALLGNRDGWFPELYNKLKSGCPDSDLPAFLGCEYRDRLGSRFDLHRLYSEIAICLATGFDGFRSPFEAHWREFLAHRDAGNCRVLELGCGSANDYRFFDFYGLARHINYSGIDVAGANIANARRRFPDREFLIGDVCAIDAADKAFDVTIAFDLYEHLSLDALSAGLSESLRVTRDELWISLFNAAETPAHEVNPVDDYHWNLLSLGELQAEIEAQGFAVEIISASQQLESRFEEYRHYNKEAHILIASRNHGC